MCELNSDVIPTSRSSLRHLYFYSNHGPQKHAQKSMLQLVVLIVSPKLDNPALATSLWLALPDIVFVIFLFLLFTKFHCRQRPRKTNLVPNEKAKDLGS